MSSSICLDCGVDTDEAYYDYYMVHDRIWRETGLGMDDGQLCIECLELRIGRKLIRTDFIYAPVNEDMVAAMYPLETTPFVDRILRIKLHEYYNYEYRSLSNVKRFDIWPDISHELRMRLYKAAFLLAE